MELKFLGRGAAFNPLEGGNSAFFIEGETLFLIDCGEGAFSKLFELKALGEGQKINRIKLFLTHTHSDHAGGIGTLAAYSFFKMGVPLEIVLPANAAYRQIIEILLTIFGSPKEQYRILSCEELDNHYEAFRSVRYLETAHCEQLLSFSILFETNGGRIFYSGDTNETGHIERLIAERSSHEIGRIYVDFTTADFEGNVHLSCKKLADAVPEELRGKIYCMHFASDSDIKAAKQAGFNAVELYS